MNADAFSSQLIAWYRKQQRDLPWRYTYNPYHIWISEIMLQQTQMERGVAYFKRWIERFPDVSAVAAADEQEILRYWQGLGYYARARNIHRAAKEIVSRFAACVPDGYQDLITLPGIGPYTAAAIASIAGNHDIAVVDTNVCRVYARLFDIAENIKKGAGLARIQEIAQNILPQGRARHFNQAIMDFGGLLCTPRNPRCGECFTRNDCLAFLRGTVEERPVLPAKKEKILQYKIVALVVCDGCFLLRQRSEKEMWAGLWDFPGVVVSSIKATNGKEKRSVQYKPLSSPAEILTPLSSTLKKEIRVEKFLISVKHQFTNHSRIVDCWLCTTTTKSLAKNERWVRWEELTKYGLPAGARKIVTRLENNPAESTPVAVP